MNAQMLKLMRRSRLCDPIRLVFYTLIGPRWFKPFAYRSFPVSTPKQGLNVVAFRNIALFLPPCFSLHLGTKKHHLLQVKRKKRFPTTKQEGPFGYFPYSQEQILRGHCELQPSATTAGIPVHSTRHWAGNVLGRTASPRIR